MKKSTINRAPEEMQRSPMMRGSFEVVSAGRIWSWRLMFLLASLLVLSACGGSASNQSQSTAQLAGNWQFTMAPPPDGSFQGGIQGGFLLQNKGSVTGGAVYSIFLPPQSGSPPSLCNSGSAPVTGTINGQPVSLTVVAGNQTFTLNGALSANGST